MEEIMDYKTPFKDKAIECVDCGVTFDWTSGEQAYFASKGLSEPKRCPNCRKARRDALAISRLGAGYGR